MTNNRVLRVDPDGTRTVYLGNTEIRYQPSTGQVRAARNFTHSRRNFDNTPTHYSTNHQGSPVATTSSAGAPQRIRYHPYGTVRNNLPTGEASNIDDRNFLYQPDDPARPSVYLNNRHYLPLFGIFATVDPLLLVSPWARNPDAYGLNSPIRFVDGRGLCAESSVPSSSYDYLANGACTTTDDVTDPEEPPESPAAAPTGIYEWRLDCGCGSINGNDWPTLGDVTGAAADFGRGARDSVTGAVESTVGIAIDYVRCGPALASCPPGYVPQSSYELVHALTHPRETLRACADHPAYCAGQLAGALLLAAIGRATTRATNAGSRLLSPSSLADEIANATGGVVKTNKGGFTVNVPNGSRGITIRVMEEGGGRTNYYRVSVPGKGTYTVAGQTSTDAALTHIPIGQSSLDDILTIVERIQAGG